LAKKLLQQYCGLSSVGGGEGLKNFDQWTEELAKDAFVRTDDEDRKVLSKTDEVFIDDDFEEE
jgi:trimethylamine:corrinoid methyltransferase-like protein